MKIAVVGPAPPDRGGIAHQTDLLVRNLGTEMCGYFSFSRRYPRWLDPRRFDAAPPESAGCRLSSGAVARFDYANPASWRATARTVVEAGAGALIVPWWTAFWALPVRGLLREVKKRDRAIPAVLLCHNVIEHESSWWKTFLSDGAFGAADGFVVHSEADRERLRRRHAGVPILCAPHPVERRPLPDRAESRRRLGVERPLVLFLGLLRPYKGLDTLLAAAPEIALRGGAEIAIVGEAFAEAGEIDAACGRSSAASRIRRVDRYVDESEMDDWLAACDVVVCPYREVSGSGIAARAAAAGRPMVASDLPGFRPFVTPETGRLFRPGDPGALAEAILQVLRSEIAFFQPGLARLRERFSWPNYAGQIQEYCRSLCFESATIAG